MANLKRGEVEVDAFTDGKARVLRFDFNALCTIEERLGQSVDQLFFSGNVSRLAIREAVTVALKHRNQAITSKKVGRLIDPEKMQPLLIGIFKGLAAANGQTDEQIAEMERMILDETDEEELGLGGDVSVGGNDDDSPLQLTRPDTTGTACG